MFFGDVTKHCSFPFIFSERSGDPGSQIIPTVKKDSNLTPNALISLHVL